jgi:hypothetical protein
MSHPPGCTLQEHAAIIGQRTSTPSSRIMPEIARFVAQTEERPSIASTGVSRHGGVLEGGCGWRSVLCSWVYIAWHTWCEFIFIFQTVTTKAPLGNG